MVGKVWKELEELGHLQADASRVLNVAIFFFGADFSWLTKHTQTNVNTKEGKT